MKRQIAKYKEKLAADGSADPLRIAFLAKDDILIAEGPADLLPLGEEILARLNVVCAVLAEPSLPFIDFLVRRATGEEPCLVPRDTETRTFLHDIPLLRRADRGDSEKIAALLRRRKGIIVEGLGIVATGAFTPEQAFIHYCSVFHAAFVKYLLDVLQDGFLLPGEEAAFADLRQSWLQPIAIGDLTFASGPLEDRTAILAEIARVGRYTVGKRLVDSAFGNISWRDGQTILISQTGAHLDELAGCIDPVPNDNSSTAGVTASSELAAHRRIFEATGARAILHGHPKLAVVMSMLCEHQAGCNIADCWRQCPRVRFVGGTPTVAGEIGAGGLAEKVAPVIGETGRALVFGHGVFTLGRNGFGEAFAALVEVENWCREEFCRRLQRETSGTAR
ncbi:MAG: class II aldolase/adducin family protein [Desulfuromonadales bacterium]